MPATLSAGWCSELVNVSADGVMFHEEGMLQVLHAGRPNEREDRPQRFRLVLSDGEHYVQALLSPALGYLVEEGKTVAFSLVEVSRVALGAVGCMGRVLVILGMKAVGAHAQMIGNPTMAQRAVPFALGPSVSTAAGLQNARAPSNMRTPSKANPSNLFSTPNSFMATPQASTSTAQHGTSSPITPSRPGMASRAPPTPSTPSSASTATPIEMLTIWTHPWAIKASVRQKTELRRFEKGKGGNWFSLVLQDASGAIKATAFGDVADNIYPNLQEGCVYRIAKARIKQVNPKYRSHVKHDYEMEFSKDTIIEECEDARDVPTSRWSLTELSQLCDLPADSLCDILAVVVDVEEITQFTFKDSNEPRAKRNMTIVDHTTADIRLTLWGNNAKLWSHEAPTMIFCRGVKVNEYQGRRSLVTGASSVIQVDPDIPGVEKLRAWYLDIGQKVFAAGPPPASQSAEPPSATIEGLCTLEEVQDAELGWDAPTRFSARATVLSVDPERTLAYASCPKCRKKVQREGEAGRWRCEKCSVSHSEPKYRYYFPFQAGDFTARVTMMANDVVGEVLFRMPASELIALKVNDEERFKLAVRNAVSRTFDVICTAKEVTYNGKYRLNYDIDKIEPADYRAGTRALLGLLGRH